MFDPYEGKLKEVFRSGIAGFINGGLMTLIFIFTVFFIL